jgi:2-isopropylmalate synthase
MGTPNVYADRIEWFLRHVRDRRSVIMSVHTHNDRASGVAASELAVMAGAERVEGALFGNGERTGNMDIMTMALNLFSQGVDPKLDFSDMERIREVYSRCTGMRVYPRHPYAGEFVFTAFSGSHQDAIHKGMKARAKSGRKIWDIPYLPIDPKDVGQSYGAIIRINSQSGKGGVAYLMEKDWGILIPKEMQRDFSKTVQRRTEKERAELSSKELRACFEETYLRRREPYALISCSIRTEKGRKKRTAVSAVVRCVSNKSTVLITGSGNGPLNAFVNGVREHLKMPLDVVMYHEHALSRGAKARAMAYAGIQRKDRKTSFGVGIDPNISMAPIRAVLSAINRDLD